MGPSSIREEMIGLVIERCYSDKHSDRVHECGIHVAARGRLCAAYPLILWLVVPFLPLFGTVPGVSPGVEMPLRVEHSSLFLTLWPVVCFCSHCLSPVAIGVSDKG